MSKAVQPYEKKVDNSLQALSTFTEEKKSLIKRTYCKDCSDDEMELFLNVCQHTGLDPTLKQIYAIKRKSKDGQGTMTIQTSIDGLRLIADRSGKYCPGKEPVYIYDKDGRLFSATSFIKKRTKDGLWHEVSATAIVSEYKPRYANDFWETKPHLMAAKCAESLALRKAFPAEMAGIYTDEEMHQAEVIHASHQPAPKEIELKPKLLPAQVIELVAVLEKCSETYRKEMMNFLKSQNINGIEEMPLELYEKILKRSYAAKDAHQSLLEKENIMEKEDE